MNFFDYITEDLNDKESEEHRNVRWDSDFIWKSVHLAMKQIRTDLVDVFIIDKEHILKRGTCYHRGFCDNDENGNPIDGVFVKALMIDGQSCKRPKLTNDKKEGISRKLKQHGSYFGLGNCSELNGSCVGTNPPECTVSGSDGESYIPYDWGGIQLDKGTNNFWTLNPTPTNRDVKALIRCSIIPALGDIENWIINNKLAFEKVEYILWELVLYYCYERDDEIQERDRLMALRWKNYKEKLQLYGSHYSKIKYLWE